MEFGECILLIDLFRQIILIIDKDDAMKFLLKSVESFVLEAFV